MVKLCECGCGNPAPIAKYTSRSDGWVKGESKRFIRFHQLKLVRHGKGSGANTWRGGRKISGPGVEIYQPDHPMADPNGYVLEHRLIAEKALGKPLPIGVVVHHPYRNRYENKYLVICPDDAYHAFLHQRMRAFEACGHANWRKCKVCKKYDDPKNLFISSSRGGGVYHRGCIGKYNNDRRVLKGMADDRLQAAESSEI